MAPNIDVSCLVLLTQYIDDLDDYPLVPEVFKPHSAVLNMSPFVRPFLEPESIVSYQILGKI